MSWALDEPGIRGKGHRLKQTNFWIRLNSETEKNIRSFNIIREGTI